MFFVCATFLKLITVGEMPGLNITGPDSTSKLEVFENVRMMSYHNIFWNVKD
jgi:hypothetical protein